LRTSPNNRPKPGSRIKVDPLKSIEEVNLIKNLLRGAPDYLCLFTLGINTNLRASDLSRVTVGMVRGLKPGQSFSIKEKKTGKDRTITVNQSVHDVIAAYLSTHPGAQPEDWLFPGYSGKHLCVPYINSLVKTWCRAVNLKGNYGSHTLRKTFGHLQYSVFKTPLPVLMQLFNHSSQIQTMTYICIQPEECKNAYMNQI
jgi:integrase